MLIVQRLAGVLLEMQALDADLSARAVFHVEGDAALAHYGLEVLGNLIAGRQVGVEVVLPLEDRVQVDLGLEAEAGLDRLLDAGSVEHRQHPRQGRIDQRDLGVGLGPEGRRRAGEELGVGDDLGMDLQPDHHLPAARLPFDHRHAATPFFFNRPLGFTRRHGRA